MKCSIVGGKCQHNIGKKDKFIFVIMPFKEELNNVYYAIETTIKEMGGYEYERADVEYTKDAIWCKRICRNILRAQYVIADITGNNPNVFYELGFAQAVDNTNPIIITQNVKDVPFDIAPINLIEYNVNNLKDLGSKIKNAIETIAAEVPIITNRTPEETIAELRKQLLDEEKRSKGFKDELKESEEKEKRLKAIIKEHEAIKADPEKQFKSTIIELEKEIAEYKAKLKLSEQEIEQVQTQWELELKEKEEKLKIYEDELKLYKQDKNIENIENILFKDTEEKLNAVGFFKLAYEEKNIDKQILLYTKVIELDDKFATAYNNRGFAYYNKGDFDKAILDHNKAIELDNKYALAYNNRGIAYHGKGDLDKAFSDFIKAIELDNKNAFAYYNLGIIYYNKGDYEKTISHYNKAIELDNNSARAYYNRGATYGEKGDFEKALSDYNKVIELDNNDTDAYYYRGNIYGRKGDFDKAISDYNKVIELDINYAKAYNNRGLAYINKGEFEKAISDFNKVIELDNQYSDAYINLKELFIITNKYGNSLEIIITLFKKVDDEIIYCLLEFITKIMLGKECNYEYEKVISLTESKIKLTWSFEELEKWLASLPASDSKNKIVELVEIVKNSCK